MGSILVGNELVGAGHGYAKGRQRVQDADGFAVRCEHLGQAFVAVGRFVIVQVFGRKIRGLILPLAGVAYLCKTNKSESF